MTDNETSTGGTESRELSKRDRVAIEHALVWLADSDDDTYDTNELHDLAEYVAYGAVGGLTNSDE